MWSARRPAALGEYTVAQPRSYRHAKPPTASRRPRPAARGPGNRHTASSAVQGFSGVPFMGTHRSATYSTIGRTPLRLAAVRPPLRFCPLLWERAVAHRSRLGSEQLLQVARTAASASQGCSQCGATNTAFSWSIPSLAWLFTHHSTSGGSRNIKVDVGCPNSAGGCIIFNFSQLADV